MKTSLLAALFVSLLSAAACAAEDCAPVPPACAPAPAVCAAAEPEPEVYYEVPVTKKVWAEEVYTVNEKRVEHAKEVVTKIQKPNRPRAARVAKKSGSPVVAYKDVHRERTSLKPIKIETVVPVAKTRKVAVEIQETTLIPEKDYLRGRRK